MQIIDVPVKSLKPYGKNPRKNDKAVEYVANSIRRFGFKQPIVIDANFEIVCGHTRWKASKVLGLETVPCVMADDLTPEEIAVYRLADNKTAEVAEWDFDLLEDEFNLIDPEEFDLSDYGFFQDDEEPEKEPSDIVEDDVPDLDKVEAVCKSGQIWQLGNHRLMCGDSTDADDVAELMDGEHSELLFTSPPYSDIREYEKGTDVSVKKLAKFIDAFAPYAEYQAVNLGIKRGNREIIPYWDKYIRQAQESGLKLMAWNVWDKGECGSVGMQSAFIPIRHEWIFVFGTKEKNINLTWAKKPESIGYRSTSTQRQKDGTTKHTTKGDMTHAYKKMESVCLISPSKNNNERQLHPATFPVALPAEYIQSLTNEGDIVTEPFGGSGSTLIACEQLDRRCFMMEISPHYCDVIIKRWEDFTGKKAELIEG